MRLAKNEGKKSQDVTGEYLDRAAKEYPDYGESLGLSTRIIQDAMNPRLMVERRTLVGGPASVRVREEIAASYRLVQADSARIEDRRRRLGEAAEKLEKAIDTLIESG